MAQYVSHCHRRVELERLEKRLGGDVDFRPGLRFKAMLDMEGKVVQLSVQEGGADRALFVGRWWGGEDLAKGPRRGHTGARPVCCNQRL